MNIVLSTLFVLIVAGSSTSWSVQLQWKPAPATLLIFTGSDWCSNCRRLEKKILSDSVFISYARDRLSIEFVDFPQNKKLEKSIVEKNKVLAEKYHFQGIYPTILLLDSTRNILGEIFYRNQSCSEFIDQIKGMYPRASPGP